MLLNISSRRSLQKASLKGIVFLVACFCALPAWSQLRNRLNLPDSDEKPFHIGIVLMGSSSRFQISQDPLFLQRDSVLVTSPENSFGIGLGGMFTLRLSNRFEARAIFPQLLFVNKAVTYSLKYPNALYDETAI